MVEAMMKQSYFVGVRMYQVCGVNNKYSNQKIKVVSYN